MALTTQEIAYRLAYYGDSMATESAIVHTI